MGHDFQIQYVNQSTSVPSMAAATTMLLNYREAGMHTESSVLRRLAELNISADNVYDVDRLAYPFGLTMLSEPCRGPSDWAKALEHGPVMVGTTSQVFLVVGVDHEFEGDAARMKIADPAMGGETWMGFSEMKTRYEVDPDIYQVKLFQA